jgi:type IV pilus assembly protein PilF
MHNSVIKKAFLLVILLVLQACVTTSDSALTRNADPETAIERYVELGFEYIKRDDFQRAQKHLKRALEIDEDSASANSAMGLIYSKQGDSKLAEAAFRTAVSSDPNYTRGRTYYGAFLFSQSRFEEARVQFLRAAEDTQYSSRSQIYTNIALCSLRLGETTKAFSAYERALQLDRFNGNALSGLTEILLDRNDYKNAQFYYNRLVRQIADGKANHSAQTLWQGIRIARHFNATPQEESLVALLNELYPDSQEFKIYRSTLNVEN